MNANTNNTEIHCFEAAGLGQAPFHFEGVEVQEAGPDGLVRAGTTAEGHDRWTTPGGSCDFCGTAIAVFCWIRSTDGRRFKVGQDCVRKTGDACLRKRVDRAVADRRKRNREARADERIVQTAALLADPTVAVRLGALPHPSQSFARQGATRLDYVRWMLEHAGRMGKLWACEIIAAAATSEEALRDLFDADHEAYCSSREAQRHEDRTYGRGR